MAWQRVALVVEARHAEDLVAALEAEGALATDLEDADVGTAGEQALFAEPGAEGGLWPRCRVGALFPETADAARAIERALASTGAPSIAAASLSRVEDADWVAQSQRQFPPLNVAPRLWIVPTWHAAPEPDALNIVLDPGAAFGTGSHPSTRLCLAWLARSVRRGDSVLDYGCGSGILAIAALKLGATGATAVDIDPMALEAARYNAGRNGVELTLASAQRMPPGSFRITVANILANPLRMLAPLLGARTDPGGALALSGILTDQAGEVIASYAPWCDLSVEGSEEGWVLLAGTRKT
jgi:ribosomal protein L11 methyltransferase